MSESAPLLPFGDPAPRTLKAVHAELSGLMMRLHEQDPRTYEEAAALFKASQKAKEDVQAAEELLENVQRLTTPANLPFPATGEAAPEPEPTGTTPGADAPAPIEATADAPQDTPSEEPGEPAESSAGEDSPGEDAPAEGTDTEQGTDGDDEGTDEDDAGEPTPAPAEPDAPATPTDSALTAALDQPLTPAHPAWPAGTLADGLLSHLGATLAPGDTVSLILTRVGEQLLVTVQPTPLANEPGRTAQALQVKGTPSALDAGLLEKLAEYREGRAFARGAVNYAAQIQAAAEEHRKATAAAAKKAPKSTTPAPKPAPVGTLTVEVAPKDATLVLEDLAGTTHPIKQGVQAALPAGEYTLSVDADGYEPRTEKLTIRATKNHRSAVVLQRPAAPSLF